MTSPSGGQDWRARKKEATRARLQEHAMRLFLEQGYDATTVEQIAAAAGVSHMTFFRYYPTKEHVAATDDYDPLIVELVLARPPEESLLESMRSALLAGLTSVHHVDREALLARNRLVLRTPALRARLWENQNITQELLVQALVERAGEKADEVQIRSVVAASLAVAATAVLAWTDTGGVEDLSLLVDHAFSGLVKD